MLYFDTKALYRIISGNRSGSLTENAELNSRQANYVLIQGGTASNPTFSMGPLASAGSSGASGQLWMFRPVEKYAGYWRIHCVVNSTKTVSCLDTCLERTSTSVKLAPTVSGKADQMWYIQSANTGDGKWLLQDGEDAKERILGADTAKKLDVWKTTDQLMITAGSGSKVVKENPREDTLWEIEYARAAVIKQVATTSKSDPRGKYFDVPT